MWQLDNRTPFAAGQGWIRDREGAEVWLVVVKASFDILPGGQTAVSEQQPEPIRIPEHFGEPGQSSIRLDSDFVLTKATTDLLVVGSAHAPRGHEVGQLDVGLRVGDLRKVLRVFGDRARGNFGPDEPKSFVSMPLVYERAFGGVDKKSPSPEKDWSWNNPVGCGFAVDPAHLKGVPMPNIEAPDRLIRGWDDKPLPSGFGVIASHWQPRASFAGTYGAHWQATRQPLMADDCDDRFFQCAPADQQTARFLVGGEAVTLTSMNPGGRLDFALPSMELSLETRFSDGERRVHLPPKLHTVIFEPDLPRVSLVWHSALECHAKVHHLDLTRIQWRVPGLSDSFEKPVENLLDLV